MTISTATSGVLLVQLIASAAMLGVICHVQLITYPQFLQIDSVAFPAWHAEYCRRISWIVGPFMLLELGAAAGSTLLLWDSPLRSWAIGGLLIVIALWAVTAGIQVPAHETLSHGLDRETAQSLVRGNWIRVFGWILRVLASSANLLLWISHQPPRTAQ